MDSLDALPADETTGMTDQETNIIREYFVPDENASNQKSDTLTWGATFRVAGYGTLLFALLANPWINRLLYKIPYINNNPIVAFSIKFALFFVLMMIGVR